MKRKIGILIILILFTGCSNGMGGMDRAPMLTPYHTAMNVTVTPVITEPVEETPTIVATPAPIIHVVGLGDTISSIALQYGVSIDAILLANPNISPTAMIVGDEVVIPAEGVPDSAKLDVPLSDAVKFEQLFCSSLAGGLWCSVMIENLTESDINFPVVTFTFLKDTGEVVTENRTPALLQKLGAGDSIPAVLFLMEVPPEYSRATVSLFTAEGPQEDISAVNIIVEESQVQLEGVSATINGILRVESDESNNRQDLTIAAAAIDAAGFVVGVRRKNISVPANSSFDFNLTVYSTGDDIAEIILYTEVF